MLRSFLHSLIFLLQLTGELSNVFYPGYQRNFWLEFSTPSTSSTSTPREELVLPPRPAFVNPGYNGTVQTVTLGQTTHIDCKVRNLQDFQVSWIRRTGNTMDLLTTERLVFSADARYSVVHVPPDNWKLVIKFSQKKDSASYLCQVNTHPPEFILVKLLVIVPTLITVDDMGEPAREKYFKPGSTIVLRCLVTNYRQEFALPAWSKAGLRLLDDKDGKRLKYEYGKDGSLELRLYLLMADVHDTGDYMCTMPGMDIQPVVLTLYLTQGEETAAIQSSGLSPLAVQPVYTLLLYLGINLLY